MLGSIATMSMVMVQQLGLLEIAKMCDSRADGMLCFSPLLTFSFYISDPSAFEAITKFVPFLPLP